MAEAAAALCACMLPAAGGLAGGACIGRALPSDWYRRLRKPALRPPAWLFGPVWTALYTSMGLASYLVWRDGQGFAACAVPYSVPVLQSVVFRTLMHSDWYDKLKKPSWTPPRWAYAPVWMTLYGGMGYASYLVWKDGAGFPGPARLPLMLYGSQLVLNWLWGPIFFGARNIPWSLVDITLLWANVAACGWAFYGINAVAGYLFVPYFLWVTLATDLNYQIYKLNCTGKGSKD